MPDDLEVALRALVIEAARALHDKRPGDLPTSAGYRVKNARRGRRALVPDSPPNWFQVGRLLAPLETKLPSWNVAVAAAKADARTRALHRRRVSGLGHGRKSSTEELPGEFLRDYFATAKRFSFSPASFRGRYEEFIRYHDPTMPFRLRWVAPLYGFAADQRLIPLDGMRIRRVGHAEAEEQMNSSANLGFFCGTFGSLFSYLLESEVEVPKQVSDIQQHGEGLEYFHHAAVINQEVMLLRTLTGLNVGAPTFGYLYDGWPAAFFSGGVIAELPWRVRPPPISLPVTPLTREQVRSYRSWRRRYFGIDASKRQPLTAAARRIALAGDRVYVGDRVVDYVSAIEGLIVPEEAPEIGYRFRLRLGHLLARGDKKVGVVNDARNLYNVRSKVVHGEMVPDEIGFSTTSPLPRSKIKPHDLARADSDGERYARLVFRELIKLGGEVPDWDALVL